MSNRVACDCGKSFNVGDKWLLPLVSLITVACLATVIFVAFNVANSASGDNPSGETGLTSLGNNSNIMEVKNLKPTKNINCKKGEEAEIEKVSIDAYAKKAIVYVRGKDVESNIQVWDLEKETLLNSKNNQNAVSVVAMSVEYQGVSSRAAYLSADGGMMLLNLQQKGKGKAKGGPGGTQQLPRVEEAKSISPMTHAYFFASGESLVLGTRQGVFVWDVIITKKLRFKFLVDKKKDAISTISRPFLDGVRIAVGCDSGAIHIASFKDDKTLFSLIRPEQKKASAIALCPYNKRLAAAEEGGPITVWNLHDKTVTFSVPASDLHPTVHSLFFLPDDRTLIYPDRQNRIVLHDIRANKKWAILEGHDQEILAMDLTMGGASLVSGDRGGALKVWDVKSVQ